MYCINCHKTLEENDRFCSACGTKVPDSTIQIEKDSYQMKHVLNFQEQDILAKQIRSAFFKLMEEIIETDFGNNEFRKFFDEFYKSEFYKSFDLRTQQLSEESYAIYTTGGAHAKQDIDQLLDTNFRALIDHFLVVYCHELHQMKLPEEMLKYASKSNLEELDLRQMIFDFLDFKTEKDKVYIDLMKIPPAKIKNAIHSFLFTQGQEKIYFICDQTVFGSCKEGFAMTEIALHWKSHFNAPQTVPFKELAEIKREAEWLSINGLFFNVNKTMNYKMMKLLKKIQLLYSDSFQ